MVFGHSLCQLTLKKEYTIKKKTETFIKQYLQLNVKLQPPFLTTRPKFLLRKQPHRQYLCRDDTL